MWLFHPAIFRWGEKKERDTSLRPPAGAKVKKTAMSESFLDDLASSIPLGIACGAMATVFLAGRKHLSDDAPTRGAKGQMRKSTLPFQPVAFDLDPLLFTGFWHLLPYRPNNPQAFDAAGSWADRLLGLRSLVETGQTKLTELEYKGELRKCHVYASEWLNALKQSVGAKLQPGPDVPDSEQRRIMGSFYAPCERVCHDIDARLLEHALSYG